MSLSFPDIVQFASIVDISDWRVQGVCADQGVCPTISVLGNYLTKTVTRTPATIRLAPRTLPV
jgi:hypothetical protein